MYNFSNCLIWFFFLQLIYYSEELLTQVIQVKTKKINKNKNLTIGEHLSKTIQLKKKKTIDNQDTTNV